jgi:hypothetical protein
MVDVYGEIKNHIKMLLATAKELGHRISGTLSYHGLIYICGNYTSVHHKFYIDISPECPDELDSIHITKIITIN